MAHRQIRAAIGLIAHQQDLHPLQPLFQGGEDAVRELLLLAQRAPKDKIKERGHAKG